MKTDVIEESTIQEISFKMKNSLRKITEYVSSKYMDHTRSMVESSAKSGVSNYIIYKLKFKEKVSLATMIKILNTVGKLDDDELILIYSILVQEYIPDIFSRLTIVEGEHNSLQHSTYLSANGLFSKIHQQCGQSQICISDNIGFSRTLVQNIIHNSGRPSVEKTNALFWYYYSLNSTAISVEMIENFLHLLCKRMFSISKRFRIELKDTNELKGKYCSKK